MNVKDKIVRDLYVEYVKEVTCDMKRYTRLWNRWKIWKARHFLRQDMKNRFSVYSVADFIEYVSDVFINYGLDRLEIMKQESHVIADTLASKSSGISMTVMYSCIAILISILSLSIQVISNLDSFQQLCLMIAIALFLLSPFQVYLSAYKLLKQESCSAYHQFRIRCIEHAIHKIEATKK